MRLIAAICVLAMLAACGQGGAVLEPASWQHYSEHYISDAGRVVDNANGNISHSEGQGYAMLLAVAANDRKTFRRLWQWTRTHLAVRRDGLFAWKWDPSAQHPVIDRNNATDGDLLIAWALARAAKEFDQPGYGHEASRLAAQIRHRLAHTTAYGRVLLPAAEGFRFDEGVVLNPSYMILPAYRELAEWDEPAFWQGLVADGTHILSRIIEHFDGLPPDWLMVSDKSFMQAPHAPLRFGYDALRVPLYVCWQGDEKRVPLQTIADSWRTENAPAWQSLQDDAVSGEGLSAAHHAMRRLLTGCLAGQPVSREPLHMPMGKDYYGSTLALLAQVAWMERNE